MGKSINILDKDYTKWIKELSSRYRRCQIKAAVKVNEAMLRFYWELGRDIVEMHIEERWGEKVIKTLSTDMQREIPDAHCFSRTNLYYFKKFYQLYSQELKIVQQVDGKIGNDNTEENVQQVDGQNKNAIIPHLFEQLTHDLFSVPWGHHMRIIDKYSDAPKKALFFVHLTVVNGWSRNMLLNFLVANQ